MREFFQVLDIQSVLALKERFEPVGTQEAGLNDALGRILAQDVVAENDIPGFDRATMDGYAVAAASTFGASESNPAYLTVVGSVKMGACPDFTVSVGQAAHIATGGMLPQGAESVVMVEHTDALDPTTIEVYRSVAPGQHVVAADDDASRGSTLLTAGCRLRPQELGILAACGLQAVRVHRRPRVAIVSTGDEVVPVQDRPRGGQIRDVNAHTLAGMVREAGAEPVMMGIVRDHYQDLLDRCQAALQAADMVLVSGGSSVGTRDLTVDALAALDDSRILVHGVSISPGKPTILAHCGKKAFWGLPGHVTSAMVVFLVLVQPFVHHIGGRRPSAPVWVKARLSRNLASAQGRVDYVRVRLKRSDRLGGELIAEPVLGASGLIRTMVEAHGLIAVDLNSEGLDKDTMVDVLLI
jgi:molybdopterin molybdotransferase